MYATVAELFKRCWVFQTAVQEAGGLQNKFAYHFVQALCFCLQ